MSRGVGSYRGGRNYPDGEAASHRRLRRPTDRQSGGMVGGAGYGSASLARAQSSISCATAGSISPMPIVEKRSASFRPGTCKECSTFLVLEEPVEWAVVKDGAVEGNRVEVLGVGHEHCWAGAIDDPLGRLSQPREVSGVPLEDDQPRPQRLSSEGPSRRSRWLRAAIGASAYCVPRRHGNGSLVGHIDRSTWPSARQSGRMDHQCELGLRAAQIATDGVAYSVGRSDLQTRTGTSKYLTATRGRTSQARTIKGRAHGSPLQRSAASQSTAAHSSPTTRMARHANLSWPPAACRTASRAETPELRAACPSCNQVHPSPAPQSQLLHDLANLDSERHPLPSSQTGLSSVHHLHRVADHDRSSLSDQRSEASIAEFVEGHSPGTLPVRTAPPQVRL